MVYLNAYFGAYPLLSDRFSNLNSGLESLKGKTPITFPKIENNLCSLAICEIDQ